MSRATNSDSTYEFLKEESAKTEADLASQEATADAQSKSRTALSAQAVTMDPQAIKQNALTCEVKADEATYLMYLS